MEKRVSPWINKKIIEYIGEPEPTLTEFVCNKVSCLICRHTQDKFFISCLRILQLKVYSMTLPWYVRSERGRERVGGRVCG